MKNTNKDFKLVERSSQAEILRKYNIIADNKDLVIFLNSITSYVSVLDMNRQIVFVNKLILKMAGISEVHEALGKRLGELFDCHHAFEANGCGTSPHCSACCALRSILDCIKTGGEVIEECSLTTRQMEAFDMRVHCTFAKVYGEEFIICSIFDISNEKRRGVMERIFFHDIMNTINGISGIAHVLPMIEPEKQRNYFSFLSRLTQSLVDDILSHRLLTMAEKNEYNVAQYQISSLDFVREEVEKYRKIASLEAKEVQITDDSENNDLITDKVLLACVLDNMIKNALEAESAGALIKVSVLMNDKGFLTISVKNDSVIGEIDQMQVFKRSFSTKGNKRGLGAYTMKLFTEKYLNGTISFESQEGKGTVFTVQIPVC